MSAEVLREAAALMRERAEAATGDAAWAVEVAKTNGIPNMVITADTSMVVADTYDKPGQADAEHIASWHPAVALAVADWLDATAAENNSPEDSGLGFLNFITADSHAALAVARTYLGSDS